MSRRTSLTSGRTTESQRQLFTTVAQLRGNLVAVKPIQKSYVLMTRELVYEVNQVSENTKSWNPCTISICKHFHEPTRACMCTCCLRPAPPVQAPLQVSLPCDPPRASGTPVIHPLMHPIHAPSSMRPLQAPPSMYPSCTPPVQRGLHALTLSVSAPQR